MIAIEFTKQRGQELIEAIVKGEPIKPGPVGWTGHDMLAAAGALFAGAFSQGPALRTTEDVERMHQERREFVSEQLFRDVHAAIELYGQLSFHVLDGDFDEYFEPRVEALVTETDEGVKTIHPHKGFKKQG